MKTNKLKSTRYRFWRSLAFTALSLVAGMLIGLLIARFDLANVDFSSFIRAELVQIAIILISLLLFSGAVYYLRRSKKAMLSLEETDNDDRVGDLDRQANRAYGIASILVGLLQIPFMFYLATFFAQDIYKSGSSFILIFGQLAFLFLLTMIAGLLFRRGFKVLNGVEMPRYSNAKETREFLMGMMDEAEKQINYEENFDLIMKLTTFVFPIVYMILFGLSLVFRLDATLALLAVSAIYMFIMVSQYRIVKRYYK